MNVPEPVPPDLSYAVVLYDGECNFCSGSVRFILPRDRRGRLRFAPLRSAAGARLLASCDRPPGALDSLVLVEDGRCHERTDATLRIASHLRFPWNLAAALRVVPRPVRDACYDWFAARRYHWFGKKDTCDVPPPEWRKRFLDSEF